MKKFIKISTAILLILASLLIGQKLEITRVEAAELRFAQIKQTSLYASISSSATSIRVKSMKTLDGNNANATTLGSITYATIEPGTVKEEAISFTGATDNGDNTITLTGVTRGLRGSYPYGTGGIAYPHTANSFIVVTNSADFYNNFVIRWNDQVIYGQKTFSTSTPPKLAYNLGAGEWTGAASNTLATIGIVRDTALASAVAGNTSTVGYYQQARASQASTSDTLGSTGANLVVGSNLVSATPGSTSTIPMTQSTGKLAQGFLDLSDQWNFTGNHVISGTSSVATTSKTIDYDLTVSVTASTTFTGATTPQPAYIATSTGALELSDANAYGAQNFEGFAVSSAVNGGRVYLQKEGVVTGFTGLTKGATYYVQDAVGTIGTATGTAEIIVGKAISANEILITNEALSGSMQYLGSVALTVGAGNTTSCDSSATSTFPMAKTIIANVSTNPGSGAIQYWEQGEIHLTKNGKTTGTFINTVTASGPAIWQNVITVTWNITSGRLFMTGNNTQASTNSLLCNGTLYFYR